MPDGGELKRENTDPALRAFAELTRLEQRIEMYRERIADYRSTTASHARFRAEIERVQEAMRAALRELPIRPSVVDDVVVELRQLDQQLEHVERMAPGPERTEKLRALETRARCRVGRSGNDSCVSVTWNGHFWMRNISSSNPTCAWWYPSRSDISVADFHGSI